MHKSYELIFFLAAVKILKLSLKSKNNRATQNLANMVKKKKKKSPGVLATNHLNAVDECRDQWLSTFFFKD